MNKRTAPNRVGSLPEPVVALLRTVHDALNIPLPGLSEADERAYAELLERWAMHARVTLACVLQDGHEVGSSATFLRDGVDSEPVTYTPWTGDGGAR